MTKPFSFSFSLALLAVFLWMISAQESFPVSSAASQRQPGESCTHSGECAKGRDGKETYCIGLPQETYAPRKFACSCDHTTLVTTCAVDSGTSASTATSALRGSRTSARRLRAPRSITAGGKTYYVVEGNNPRFDSGEEVCKAVKMQCVGFADTVEACTTLHGTATVNLQSKDGTKQGFYCDGSPQKGYCANTKNTCAYCPKCNVNKACGDPIGDQYREMYVECMDPGKAGKEEKPEKEWGEPITSADGAVQVTLPAGVSMPPGDIKKLSSSPVSMDDGSPVDTYELPDMALSSPALLKVKMPKRGDLFPVVSLLSSKNPADKPLLPLEPVAVVLDAASGEVGAAFLVPHFSKVVVSPGEYASTTIDAPDIVTVGEPFDIQINVHFSQKPTSATLDGGTKLTRTPPRSWSLHGSLQDPSGFFSPGTIPDLPTKRTEVTGTYSATGRFTCTRPGSSSILYNFAAEGDGTHRFAPPSGPLREEEVHHAFMGRVISLPIYCNAATDPVKFKVDIRQEDVDRYFDGLRSSRGAQSSARMRAARSSTRIPSDPRGPSTGSLLIPRGVGASASSARSTQTAGRSSSARSAAVAPRSAPASVPSAGGAGALRFELDPPSIRALLHGAFVLGERSYFATAYQVSFIYEDLSRPISGIPTLEQMRAGTHGIGYRGQGQELVDRGIVTMTWTNSTPCGNFFQAYRGARREGGQEAVWEHGPPCSGHPEGGPGERAADPPIVHPGTITVMVRDNVTGRELRATYDQGSLVPTGAAP